MNQSPSDPLSGRIYTIRGQRVILDANLARLYGTTTKVFNQSIKRNAARFPKDFAFQLDEEEVAVLRSQIVTSKPKETDDEVRGQIGLQSAIPPGTERRGGRRYMPWVFTEHGAVMAANVLRNPKAVEMSVYVVRAFIAQREVLTTNATILKRLAEIDKTLLEHNSALLSLWKKLKPLLAPPPESPRKEMGFHVSMKGQKLEKTTKRKRGAG